jgi:hypothetical protein
VEKRSLAKSVLYHMSFVKNSVECLYGLYQSENLLAFFPPLLNGS